MDAFSEPEAEEIVLCKSVQIGGTEAMYNMMGWAIEQSPAPMMMVLPTIEIAAYVSRNRLQPMIDIIPSLNIRKSSDVNEYNLMEMNFTGMVLTLAGANSAPSLATRPIRYLFMDEVDKFPAYAGREGEPIGLATERTRTFWNRKIVKISTPTVSIGNIWHAYQSCMTKYEFYVPCPICNHYQTLTFWGEEKTGDYHLRWHEEGESFDADDLIQVYENTWYECCKCKARLKDKDKAYMLEHGEWRDQNGISFSDRNRRSRSIGFHINALYSPWVSWGEVAVKFLKSREKPEDYMNFVNLWLGLPVRDTVEENIPDNIEHLYEDYKPGIVPAEALTLIMTVDVQKYYLQYLIRAWGPNLESWLVREGVLDDFDDLRDMIQKSSYNVEGTVNMMKPRLCLIDAGFRTEEVYDFVRLNNKVCKATKGSSHPLKAPYSASRIETYPDGRKIADGVTLWLFDTNYWKDALARRLGLIEGENQALSLWHVYKEVSQSYIYQLTAEEKVNSRNRRTGKTSLSWQLKAGRKRNEAFDLEVMNLMGADMIGLKYYSNRQQSVAPVVHTSLKKPVKVARSKWMRNVR